VLFVSRCLVDDAVAMDTRGGGKHLLLTDDRLVLASSSDSSLWMRLAATLLLGVRVSSLSRIASSEENGQTVLSGIVIATKINS